MNIAPKNPAAFTLIEMLIAISLFTTVVFITSVLFVDSLRLDRKSSLQQQVYIDARYTLDKIAQAIRSGTIDYEEYENQIVLSKKDHGAEYQNPYGAHYGEYAKLFFDPGTDGRYGQQCNDGTTLWKPGVDCTVLETSIDRNTGQNPYAGKSGVTAAKVKINNAVCNTELTPTARCRDSATPDTPFPNENIFSELYLISADGSQKTMFVKEEITAGTPLVPPVGAVSWVKMKGADRDNDGIPDVFSCDQAAGFNCRGIDAAACGTAPLFQTGDFCPLNSDKLYSDDATDLADASKDFVPISPNRIDVKDLKFFIAPLEDPRRAFAEKDVSVQKIPHVTITMTVGLNTAMNPSAEKFSLTLQETVSTTLLDAVPAPIPDQYNP